ncbi:helix-turn-helix domain-containing protein [Methylococcus mesophilus]|uniref:hypothetical protein n=1 Tax=Methylococcus mesophilus TaxID=2993564 RepID=UPI00224A8E25|nr:hypothetical protein [Methylococcus mesophilus]UZR29060.1 hypothetical protein OOT43_00105 [Methylococcus mesophilus]
MSSRLQHAKQNESVFSILPIEVCQNFELTSEHLRVLIALGACRNAGTNTYAPSIGELGDLTEMDEHELFVALDDLEAMGWVFDGRLSFPDDLRQAEGGEP